MDLAAARRILVVRPDNIGDVVLLTPALRALRAAAPQARIELLASPAGTAVAAMIPELDGVLTASPNWQQLTAPANSRECTTRVPIPASSPRCATGHGDWENEVSTSAAS